MTAVGALARPSSWERLLAQLDRARAARLPVLLSGERGTGKTMLARTRHERAQRAGTLTILDPAAGGQTHGEWTRQLAGAIGDPAATVVLRHLDALSPALAAPTVRLIEAAQAWLVATATVATQRAGPSALAEHFPVVLRVPPLRDRAADIPALVTALIAELRPEPPRARCTPQALAALAGGEWPGNVRQLRQVVATALVRSLSCDITVDDLPDASCWAGRDSRRSRLEEAERQALLTALRDVAWDREAAARDLGISRATIYRKLKRHGIRPPAAATRRPAGAEAR
jgi:sigma-54 dependent transcriptional regulator, acetoin dehydrogenase operon transcriptional activator AcoR